jgi:hypothetical protein
MKLSQGTKNWLGMQKDYHEKQLEMTRKNKLNTRAMIKQRARKLVKLRAQEKEILSILNDLEGVLSKTEWEV